MHGRTACAPADIMDVSGHSSEKMARHYAGRGPHAAAGGRPEDDGSWPPNAAADIMTKYSLSA